MEKINVLIIDDSFVIRGMLSGIFEADPSIRVIGAVSSTEAANRVIAQQLVDVVTLDNEMPGLNGLDYLPSLVRRHLPTVMLAAQVGDGSENRALALERGAYAWFNKADAARNSSKLLDCIKAAAVHKHKSSAAANGSVAEIESALEHLITQHGDGLKKVIAERVGTAILEGDKAEATKWIGIAGKFEELLAYRAALRSAAEVELVRLESASG